MATTGLGHTRWATHGGVNEDERASAHRLRRRQARDRAQRHRRELPRAARPSSRPPATCSAPRPTPRSSRTCSRRPIDGDLVEAVRAVFARLDGHFSFVVIHHDEPERLVGVRHQTPLVVGLGDGENFVALERRRVPRRDAPRPVPGRRRDHRAHAAGRPLRARVRRRAGRARGPRDRLGRGGRRARRLRDVHAQGDPRAARGLRRDDRRPRPPRASRARRARHGPRTSCASCAGS